MRSNFIFYFHIIKAQMGFDDGLISWNNIWFSWLLFKLYVFHTYNLIFLGWKHILEVIFSLELLLEEQFLFKIYFVGSIFSQRCELEAQNGLLILEINLQMEVSWLNLVRSKKIKPRWALFLWLLLKNNIIFRMMGFYLPS